MKKVLLIFLLVLLPLQYAWAAAAVYCKHEQSQSTKHFGHHSHHHDVKAGDADKPEKLPTVDNDCGTCHMSAQPSFISAVPLLMFMEMQAFAPQPPPIYDSYIPDGLQRPDWRALV